jgi:hypothetical protein
LPDGLSGIFLREGLDNGFRKSGSDLPVGQFADEAHCTDHSRLGESALLFGLSVVSLAEIGVVVSIVVGKGQSVRIVGHEHSAGADVAKTSKARATAATMAGKITSASLNRVKQPPKKRTTINKNLSVPPLRR